MCCLWAGTAPGRAGPESVLGRTEVFPSKKSISGLAEGLWEKRSIVPYFCLVPPPSDQRDSKAKQGISTWISVLCSPREAGSDVMGTAASWAFLGGRKFCAGEQTQALQVREEGISPKPHLGRFCTFLGNKFLMLLWETAHSTRARLRCSHPLLCSFCGSDIPRGGKRFCQNKVGRKMNSLKLPHWWLDRGRKRKASSVLHCWVIPAAVLNSSHPWAKSCCIFVFSKVVKVLAGEKKPLCLPGGKGQHCWNEIEFETACQLDTHKRN